MKLIVVAFFREVGTEIIVQPSERGSTFIFFSCLSFLAARVVSLC